MSSQSGDGERVPGRLDRADVVAVLLLDHAGREGGAQLRHDGGVVLLVGR
jgi:hypothetical protein